MPPPPCAWHPTQLYASYRRLPSDTAYALLSYGCLPELLNGCAIEPTRFGSGLPGSSGLCGAGALPGDTAAVGVRNSRFSRSQPRSTAHTKMQSVVAARLMA